MGMFGNLGADKYDRSYSDGYLLQRLWTYFLPFKPQVAVIVVTTILFSIAQSILPVLISAGINEVRRDAFSSGVTLVVVATFLTAIAEYILYWLRRSVTGQVVGSVVSQLRKDAFDAAIRRDLGFYDENKTGKIVSRITSDTQELSQVILISADIVSQMTTFIILFIVLFSREWRLTLILLALLPIITALSLMFRHFARLATRQGSRAMAAVNDNIQESVTGITVAKNFRQEAMIYDAFRSVNEESYRINLRRGFVLATVFPTLNALAGFAFALIVYVGAQFVFSGIIDVGVWYLFVQGIDAFWFPFINLSAYWNQVQQGLSATERIFALVDAENTVNQSVEAPVPPLRGEIEFRDVVFEYKNGERVLDDFSLHIQPNESIALVGHTGAGKSTIAKLIERFYEFQTGELLIDGIDIRTLSMPQFRPQLGIVPQQPFLFRGTILDNVRYARPDATDEEISILASSIGEGEWLAALPNGLQSEVGERGARLSMGQRQLVSLLRVLVQKPAIFILDEATASIDPFTEGQIQEALDMILARSTSILIAHRLSTVRSADRIIVLDHGRIIEQGSHEQLMAVGGHYAVLYDTYFRHQSLSYVEHARELLSEAGD